MRKFWGDPERFDKMISEQFVLQKNEIESKESMNNWLNFCHKLSTVNCKLFKNLSKNLIDFLQDNQFFKTILKDVLLKCIN